MVKKEIKGTALYRLSKKLDEVKKKKLKQWNKKMFNLQFKKQYLKQELEAVEQEILWKGIDKETDLKERHILVEYYNTLTQEEMHWKQKSRIT